MTRGEVAYKGFERWRNAWCMTGSDRLRMKKPLKKHEAHSWKKGGKPFTDQTDGGGRGFTHKVLRVETQQPGSSRPTSRLKRWSSGVRWICSAFVDHTRLLPSNQVVLLPRMLSNRRLLLLSFPACILVLANPLLQPSSRFPYVHLPATTRNTIYYTRTHASWQLILDPGELCSQSHPWLKCSLDVKSPAHTSDVLAEARHIGNGDH